MHNYRVPMTPGRRRERQKWAHRKMKYGLSQIEWLKLFLSQGAVCAICGGTEPHGPDWATDHNHHTGQTRGILCFPCNMGLAVLEKRDWTIAATAYLEQRK